jgi:type IV pilus assembly protein PilV
MIPPIRSRIVAHASGTRRAGGYTVVEILLAMTLLTIGAAGAMSMQKASMQGNLDARRMDVATAIGRMWLERIRKDAMAWTLPSPADPGGASNFSNALLLSTYAGKGWSRPDIYLPATPPLASISPGFDILGRDVPKTLLDTNTTFCVHVNETWVIGNGSSVDDLLRVDLRVVWSRGITSSVQPCTTTASSAVFLDNTQYAAIYMSTLVRANGLP